MPKDAYHSGLVSAAAVALMALGVLVAVAYPISRIDLFDKANNRLMFVTFTTDAAGNRLGDSVFMADSTFVKATTVQSGGKETSTNFNGDPWGATTIAASGATKTFSVIDPFGQDELGGPVSYTGDGTNFTLSQRGAVINKMRYTQGTNGDLRIDVNDNAGNLLHSAATYTSAVASKPAGTFSQRSSLSMVGLRKCRIAVHLPSAAHVRAELFLTSGRNVAVLVDERMKPGAHSILVPTPKAIAGGLYVLRLSINGRTVAQSREPMQMAAQSLVTATASDAVPPSLIFELLALNGDLETAAYPKYLSPTALVASPDKSKLYVAEQTAKRVAVVTLSSRTVTGEYLMPNEPTGIAVSADGATLYVTCSSDRWPDGMVCIVNAATGAVSRRIPVGHGTRAPVLGKDGSKLYVCNLYDHTVSVVDLAQGAVAAQVLLIREPYCAAITPDGSRLLVMNSMPDEASTDTALSTGKLSIISTATNAVVATVRATRGSHSFFGLCVSADGRYAFAPHLIGMVSNPPSQITQSWIHSNNLAVFDVPNAKFVNDVCLDPSGATGRANPWACAVTGDGKYLCITLAGSGDLTMIDVAALVTKAQGPDMSCSYTGLQGISATKSLRSFFGPSMGPRTIALVNNIAYVGEFFGDVIDMVDVSSPSAMTDPTQLSLGVPRPATSERRGEASFYDASLCQGRWQSCSSCHPFARADGLNWTLGSIANKLKNAKSMLYAAWTPPTTWKGTRTGIFGTEGSVRNGMLAELGIAPDEAVAVTLDTFLMRIKPVPSPYLVKGRLSSMATTGKSVFQRVGCASCHPAPLFTTDQPGGTHTPGPKFVPEDPTAGDQASEWNIPSLNEGWRTGPYGHLGSYVTIDSCLHVKDHSYEAWKLDPRGQDFKALVEFCLSL